MCTAPVTANNSKGAGTAARVLEKVQTQSILTEIYHRVHQLTIQWEQPQLTQSITLVPEMYIPTCSPVNNSKGAGTAARVRGQKYLVNEKYQRFHKYPECINYNVSRTRV